MIILTLAGCLLLDDDGRLLLIHRNTPGRVQWELPGGKIEPGETAEETVRREAEEELGISIAVQREVGQQSFQEDGYTLQYHWFLAHILSGTPACMEEKYDDLTYFSWQELPHKDDISSNTRNLVTAYFNQELTLN